MQPRDGALWRERAEQISIEPRNGSCVGEKGGKIFASKLRQARMGSVLDHR